MPSYQKVYQNKARELYEQWANGQRNDVITAIYAENSMYLTACLVSLWWEHDSQENVTTFLTMLKNFEAHIDTLNNDNVPFHQHPCNPTSCEAYEEAYSKDCPCLSYDK